MEDSEIVDLYWAKSERAIEETKKKYSQYCHAIAYNVLSNAADADECVNDLYLAAWNSIPPNRPAILSTFLGKLTRRIAIDKYRRRSAKMRGGGEAECVWEELSECIESEHNVEREAEAKELADRLASFVSALPDGERRVFVCRYWYFDSIKTICTQFGYSESKTKSMLFRTRKKLLRCLKEEGMIHDKV